MYAFGDTVLVPFPFSDQTGTKKRPAVVVSSDELNRRGIDIVIAAVTSRPRRDWSDTSLSQWSGAGLLRPSVARTVLATIDRGLVLRRLGRLQRDDRQALRRTLRRSPG